MSKDNVIRFPGGAVEPERLDVGELEEGSPLLMSPDMKEAFFGDNIPRFRECVNHFPIGILNSMKVLNQTMFENAREAKDGLVKMLRSSKSSEQSDMIHRTITDLYMHMVCMEEKDRILSEIIQEIMDTPL